MTHQTTFTSNTAGQPVSVTDVLSHATLLTYDLADLTTVTDPLGRVTTQSVAAAGA